MRALLDPYYRQNSRLMTAVMERDIGRVQNCLDKGARAGAINGNGHTAVGMAAALGEVEILRVLIAAAKDRSPARDAAADVENVAHTPEGMDDLEWENEFEETPAVKNNYEEDEQTTSLYYYYAKTLEATGSILFNIKASKRKEDPHVPDETMMTPLHYAAAFGHLQCVKLLLDSGCNVNPVNDDGFTPLHLGTKHSNVILTLLKNGANPNLRSINTQETALHIAVRNKCIEGVKWMIRHGHADIDAVNVDDRTPLMCAIRFDAEDIVMFLLDNNARINLQDEKGRTALYYAVTRNKEEIVKRLLQKRARRLPEHGLLHNCVRLNLKEMVELLVTHGDNLLMRDHSGLTPVMTAIVYKNFEMLDFLLSMTSKMAERPRNFYYLGNELYLAVESTADLMEFRNICSALFSYTTATTEEAAKNGEIHTPCSINFCSTPLAHAIRQNKLRIASFLIKEGIGVEDICMEHNVPQLRQVIDEISVLEFTKFLVKCGFKFPYIRPPYPNSWLPKRILYEFELFQMCTTPLSLKDLSRLAIRKALTRKPFGDRKGLSSHMFRLKHRESILEQRILELGLPKSLQIYLYEFPETSF